MIVTRRRFLLSTVTNSSVNTDRSKMLYLILHQNQTCTYRPVLKVNLQPSLQLFPVLADHPLDQTVSLILTNKPQRLGSPS